MTRSTALSKLGLWSAKRPAIDLFKIIALAFSIAVTWTYTPAAAQEQPSLIKTAVVEGSSGFTSRTFFGEISARQTVDLGFQVSGRIVEFEAEEGAVLSRETVVARLDPRPFEIEIERAQLNLEQAQRTLDRYEILAGSAVSQAQVLDARTDVELAQAALENARFSLEQSVLTTPFDAIVAERRTANFSSVSSGTVVLRLHDLSELRVSIEVPEIMIQTLGGETDVDVRARFPGDSRTYPLVYRETRAQTSDIGQTFEVTLALVGEIDRVLLPGASVVVEAEVNETNDGVSIPISALGSDPDGTPFVFKVVASGESITVVRQDVELGTSQTGEIVVINGLDAGDEIATGGIHALSDGDTIRRFNASF